MVLAAVAEQRRAKAWVREEEWERSLASPKHEREQQGCRGMRHGGGALLPCMVATHPFQGTGGGRGPARLKGHFSHILGRFGSWSQNKISSSLAALQTCLRTAGH